MNEAITQLFIAMLGGIFLMAFAMTIQGLVHFIRERWG